MEHIVNRDFGRLKGTKSKSYSWMTQGNSVWKR